MGRKRFRVIFDPAWLVEVVAPFPFLRYRGFYTVCYVVYYTVYCDPIKEDTDLLTYQKDESSLG
jgi:hypothetical protein